jgi:hypothetical protein
LNEYAGDFTVRKKPGMGWGWGLPITGVMILDFMLVQTGGSVQSVIFITGIMLQMTMLGISENFKE